MNKVEIDREIRATLRRTFEYLNVDSEHCNNATLRCYLEQLIRKVQEN